MLKAVLEFGQVSECQGLDTVGMDQSSIILMGNTLKINFSQLSNRFPITLVDWSADTLEKLKPESLLFSPCCYSGHILSPYTTKSAMYSMW